MLHHMPRTGLALLLACLALPAPALAETVGWTDHDMGCESPSFHNLPEDGHTLAPMAIYGIVVPFDTRNVSLDEIGDAIAQGTIALEVFEPDGMAIVGMLELEYDGERRFVWRPLQNVAPDATYTARLTLDWPNLVLRACGDAPETAEVRTWSVPVIDLPMLEPLTPDDFYVTEYIVDESMTCCAGQGCIADGYLHRAHLEASVMLGEGAGGFLRHEARFFIEGEGTEQRASALPGSPFETLGWRRTLASDARTGRLCVEIETHDALFERSVTGEAVCLTWDEIGPEPPPLEPVPEDFCEGQVAEPDLMEPVETDPDPDPDVADPAPSTPDVDAASAPDGSMAEDESGVVAQDDGGTDCACAVRTGQPGPGRLPLALALAGFAIGLGARRRARWKSSQTSTPA